MTMITDINSENSNDAAEADTAKNTATLSIVETKNRVDKQLAESDKMRAQASLLVMENEIANAISSDISESDEEFEPGGSSSPRVLELGRRRSTVRLMRHEIDSGAAILKTLAQNSDLLLNYFDAAEKELEHLEAVELASADLKKKCAELSTVKQKAVTKITDQQKQIHLLEAKKNQARETIADLQANLNQARSEIDTTRSKMATQNTKISKLADDLGRATEELSLVETANRDLWAQNEAAMAENESLRGQLAELQRTANDMKEMVDELTEDKATVGMELKDVAAKYKSLREKYAEQTAELEDKNYALETMAEDYEEKYRLKDAHIFKLESEINVSEKQVMMADDMIASLRGKLSDLKLSDDKRSLPKRSVAADQANKSTAVGE